MPSNKTEAKRRISLKDLYRHFEVHTIEDGGGGESVFGIRSLTQGESDQMRAMLDGCRAEADAYYAQPNQQKAIQDSYAPMGREDLIKNILSLEEPTARDNIDLSPGLEPSTVAEAGQKILDQLEAWRTRRRDELEKHDEPFLKLLAVQRATLLFRQSRQYERWADCSLTLMIVDPETRQPILTLDPEGSPNRKEDDGLDYFYDLQPMTRRRLLELRNQFTGASPKEVREIVTEPDFLSPGGSPAASTSTPGETTSTPSTSPEDSPPPTQNASG